MQGNFPPADEVRKCLNNALNSKVGSQERVESESQSKSERYYFDDDRARLVGNLSEAAMDGRGNNGVRTTRATNLIIM